MHIEPDRMTRDQLLARVDSLEAELEAIREANKPADTLHLQRAFGLSLKECELLLLLSDGRPRRKEQIHSGLYSDRIDDPPEIKIVDVFVCKLRKKVEPYGLIIETIWGSGYTLHDKDGVIKNIIAGGELLPPCEAPDRPNPPHLIKRKWLEDYNAVLAELAEMTGGSRRAITFTSRELAARTGARRSIALLLRWLESKGALKIITSPPPGTQSQRLWQVKLTHRPQDARAA